MERKIYCISNINLFQLFLGVIFPLLIGSLIYLFLRTDTLLMFEWFEKINLNEINSFRKLNFLKYFETNDWFKYSLPNGLWVFSYISLILLIWENKITRGNILWIFTIPCLSIVSEIGQKISIISGTFDSTDLIFYLIGTILPLFIFYRPIKSLSKYKKLNFE